MDVYYLAVANLGGTAPFIIATGSSVLPLSVVLMFSKPAGLTLDNRGIY